jgi:hypothetical protein
MSVEVGSGTTEIDIGITNYEVVKTEMTGPTYISVNIVGRPFQLNSACPAYAKLDIACGDVTGNFASSRYCDIQILSGTEAGNSTA